MNPKPFALHIGQMPVSNHATFEAARAEYERLRDESGKGYRSWPKGKIVAGKAIIYLSYNGAAWADEKLTRPVMQDVLEQLQRDADSAVTLKIGRRHTGEYQTAADARDAYKRLRDESMEGGSTWPDGVITSGSTKVYLSYNGRAWADRQHTQSIEL